MENFKEKTWLSNFVLWYYPSWRQLIAYFEDILDNYQTNKNWEIYIWFIICRYYSYLTQAYILSKNILTMNDN